jgi:hypothetical protein
MHISIGVRGHLVVQSLTNEVEITPTVVKLIHGTVMSTLILVSNALDFSPSNFTILNNPIPDSRFDTSIGPLVLIESPIISSNPNSPQRDSSQEEPKLFDHIESLQNLLPNTPSHGRSPVNVILISISF